VTKVWLEKQWSGTYTFVSGRTFNRGPSRVLS